MTRHAAYALHADGRPYRHPFASFPHEDAARRFLANRPAGAKPVRFVPALPADAPEDDTLGACGCRDYHAADCPLRTGGTGRTADDWYAVLARRDPDDDYGYDA